MCVFIWSEPGPLAFEKIVNEGPPQVPTPIEAEVVARKVELERREIKRGQQREYQQP